VKRYGQSLQAISVAIMEELSASGNLMLILKYTLSDFWI